MANGETMFKLRDAKTMKVVKVRAASDVATFDLDGVRVKVFPQAIKLFIAVGAVFDAKTAFGPRLMRRME